MRLLTYSLTQLSDLGLKKNTTRFLLPLPMILASLAWKFDWRALQSNNNASETRMPVPSRTSTSARKQSHFMSNQRELFRTEIAHQKLSMEAGNFNSILFRVLAPQIRVCGRTISRILRAFGHLT